MCVGEMWLGTYEIKAGRLEEARTYLQTSLSVLQDMVPTSRHTADCALASSSFFFCVDLIVCLQVNFTSLRCLLL